ncbi:TfuA-like protein [Rhizobium grahamii]|uniref:Toxin n=2 Tax=Rhizobium grahamii TaxID=1120045 RepID=A0A370KIH2_9HYPH|nr:TfuA-like protein [Rhizobium grahamii]EPE94907.1 putative trifolitoxin related protein [Rhizobium grahamii CCGE 502]RDJ05686.1 toxin [Rhizobium grahamii]
MRIIFAGPSFGADIDRLRAENPLVIFRGPAARGDILQAVQDGARAIGIVDGFFGEVPSVWHKEILYALQHNVIVAGGASMGALRAAECADFGMVGIGSIYKDYESGALVDDEAVALVHAPAELGWLPLSIPWVDFEPTINRLYRNGVLSPSEQKMLLLAGRSLHFSERTYPKAVECCNFSPEGRAREILRAIRAGKVERKRQDADLVLQFLRGVQCVAQNRDWGFAATSHWEHLRAEVTGTVTPVTPE